MGRVERRNGEVFHALSRRDFLTRAVASGAAVLLPACAAPLPLTVAAHAWIGYESLFLARHFGWMPETVRLLATASASESLDALHADRAQAATLTLDEVLQGRSQGLPLTVVLIFDLSAGADVLMVREGITQLADLRGRRVAVEDSALGSLMLAKVLERAGLARSEVEVVDLAPERQPAAWQSESLDGAICYEPAASMIEALGGRRLFDSRQIPDTIFDVLAVCSDRIDGRMEALQGLVAGHFQALEHIRLSRQDAVYRIAAREQTSSATIERALAGVAFPGLSGNRRYLSGGAEIRQVAKMLNRIMVSNGLLSAADDLSNLLDDGYLPKTGAEHL